MTARVELMGLAIDAYTEDGLIERLIGDSNARIGGYLMTPNLDNLRGLTRDPELMRRAQAADVRVADGMPLLWASRLQGTPLPARVPGSDLIFSLARACARTGKTMYLLGGEPGSADDASAALRAELPGLRVVGTHCPPMGFERDERELAAIRSALHDAAPDFVLIGLPFPKASALAADLRQSMPTMWFLGIGISFSFVSGDVVRAPRWMQRAGLEWLHRLRQEPKRLARRYILEGLPFAAVLLRSALENRRSGRVVASSGAPRGV